LPDEAGSDMEESRFSRRHLLTWLARGFLSLWGLAFAWVVAAFTKPPRARGGIAERVIKVGPLESLPVGQARLVRHGREPIFVIRTAEDAVVGLSGVCSHVHCVLRWDDAQGNLACPCHDGAFDVNGNVLHGPPPRPLKRYQVETRLGDMYVQL